MLLLALRGNVILYQGEELGLVQDDIPFELLQDPEAIANWPLTLSRDGVRTPMPWRADAPNGGFTTGTPWLPMGAENLSRAVDVQEAEPTSLLHWTRSLLALRRATPALRLGSFEVIHADADVLAFVRRHEGQAVAGLFNLSSRPVALPEGLAIAGQVLASVNGASLEGAGDLPGYGGLLVALPG